MRLVPAPLTIALPRATPFGGGAAMSCEIIQFSTAARVSPKRDRVADVFVGGVLCTRLA